MARHTGKLAMVSEPLRVLAMNERRVLEVFGRLMNFRFVVAINKSKSCSVQHLVQVEANRSRSSQQYELVAFQKSLISWSICVLAGS
jgi:hypothetical protein